MIIFNIEVDLPLVVDRVKWHEFTMPRIICIITFTSFKLKYTEVVLKRGFVGSVVIEISLCFEHEKCLYVKCELFHNSLKFEVIK